MSKKVMYSAIELGKLVANIDGSEAKLPNNDGTSLVSFTVKEAFRRALNGVYQDEMPSQQNATGISFEKKIERYNLSVKIFNAKDKVELSAAEQLELENCVGKYFQSPEVLGFLNGIMKGEKTV